MPESGDIVISPTNGERRVVVDVADYSHESGDPDDVHCVLRYPDGDPRRELDEDGGDVHLFGERAGACDVVGRI